MRNGALVEGIQQTNLSSRASWSIIESLMKAQLSESSSSKYFGMAFCLKALPMNGFVGLAHDFEGVGTISSSELMEWFKEYF